MKNFIAIFLLTLVALYFSGGLFGEGGIIFFFAFTFAAMFSLIMHLEKRIIELENKLNGTSSNTKEEAVDHASLT